MPTKITATSSRPGSAADEPAQHRAQAGERLDAVAATARHEPAGDHQHHGQQQRRDDAGRKQICDGDAAARRGGIQDQVVRRRHQQRHEAARHGDAHRIVPIEAALDHLRDHRAADRGNIGDGGAGHAAEEQRRQHVDLAEAAAQVADERSGERDEAIRDASAHHHLARKDEQRNGDQRGHAPAPAAGLLHDHHCRQAEVHHGGERGSRECECDGHADQQQKREDSEQNGYEPRLMPRGR